MFALDEVSAGYRQPVLHDLSLQVVPGEVLALIGPNGAGKSTLLRVLSGVLRPRAGSVSLAGRPLRQLSARERARLIAVVPQSARLPESFTVQQVVLMGRAPHLGLLRREAARDYAIVAAALERTAMTALAERRVGELSGGEQQRVLLARALAQEPRILLCDEATAHLDLKQQGLIMRLLRDLVGDGLTVIAAIHDLTLAASIADRIALLAAGRLLCCDRPQAVLTPAWLRQAYEVPALSIPHPLTGAPMVLFLPDEEALCAQDL